MLSIVMDALRGLIGGGLLLPPVGSSWHAVRLGAQIRQSHLAGHSLWIAKATALAERARDAPLATHADCPGRSHYRYKQDRSTDASQSAR
jgi:hypothetical protein